jgi:hypothetical protein
MSAKRAKELETMPDEDIDYSDIPPLDEAFFKKAKRVERTLKEEVGLANAIIEGRKNDFVSEEKIFSLLDGNPE